MTLITGTLDVEKDTWVLDCRHFCSPVVDVWNQVLFNLMC